MSIAEGARGEVKGRTLPLNLTQGDYRRGDHAGDGWYAGVRIKWPQKD